MTPGALILLFAILGITLLFAELLLPTHGVLGIAAGACFIGAIVVCFRINQWLGLGVLLGTIAASPFVYNFLLNAWMKSPVGKRIVLQPQETLEPVPRVRVGQAGVACSDLRPIGECDFDDVRVEAMSEYGIIHAGEPVKIVSMHEGRPTVRPAKQPTTA